MSNKKEIWRVIYGQDGYLCSSKGRVKSFKKAKPHILKPWVNKGYLYIGLSQNGIRKKFKIHQLMAVVFLNHTPCGYKKVVDHIDNNSLNNDLSNLQIISQRENASKDRKGISKHTGLNWCKNSKKWRATIYVNGKAKFLGSFSSELEASCAYQKALSSLNNDEDIIVEKHNYSSPYKGVSWYKRDKKWRAYIYIKRKCHHLGYFLSEIDASNAVQNELKKIKDEYSTEIGRNKRNSEDIHSSLRQ